MAATSSAAASWAGSALSAAGRSGRCAAEFTVFAAPGFRAEAASAPSRTVLAASGLLRAEAAWARLSCKAPDGPLSALPLFALSLLAVSVLAAPILAFSVLPASILSALMASLRAEAVSSRRDAGRAGAAGRCSAASRLNRAVPSAPRAADEAGRRVCLKNASARSARETTMPSLSFVAEAAGDQSKPRTICR
ncbi:hypothetical protein [Methylorubrum sp. GM97]|uniref:hypothetical protein n=1 Tax=Methylorubrum sp. GM97 TaxID=2938232 RepID=UPI0021C3AFD3|nr:hypothetical protein [Methylorubrum sp. GM97]